MDIHPYWILFTKLKTEFLFSCCLIQIWIILISTSGLVNKTVFYGHPPLLDSLHKIEDKSSYSIVA